MRCRSGKVRWKTKMSNDTAAEELVAPTSWMCVATKSDNGLSAKVEIYHGNILWLPIEDEAGPKSRRRPGSLAVTSKHCSPPNDRLDNRRLPLSAVLTRVGIGAVRIGVKQRLHFLAAPEEGNGLAFDRNQSPCARISSSPAFPEPYKKNSKSPQFDPITARHCGSNL